MLLTLNPTSVVMLAGENVTTMPGLRIPVPTWHCYNTSNFVGVLEWQSRGF
ncbi:hypothetical protein DPMN_080980 [Dreissena polymorpha]|uniref:Uncharacterized protein n=1 Tax=Dreissena polymorpha TaxID=45954 RepID=A0A9D4BFV6_DREPO|nr:hypothetical protein DPMN_080967 [Dreissena polymorpha]KAH3693547.1 hypothetical protein DPMN_080980 [Dreissena polymorpha]